MGRKEKPKAKAIIEHEQDTLNAASTPSLVFTSDGDDYDDYEANQDLSLKIVEKAIRLRAAKHAPNDAVSTKPELALPQNDDVSDSEITVKKKTTRLKVQAGDQSVIMAEEQEMGETTETADNHESVKDSTVQIGDNMVLRKLLRGPRYFDPDNNSWGACFNCGEEGHTAVHCTAEKRKKPCYVCGGLGHNAKQCTKSQDCFICKKGGHRAKNCPEKHYLEKHASTSKSILICLKCGNSGHDMFFCRSEYSLDDIKEIQCYACKRLGHLCCVNTDDATPGEISCYKCGRLGHTGLACSRLRDEIATGATPGSCFKCGEEGHFARECTSSIKAGKRYRESSNTKDKSFQKENDYMGNRFAPNDMGGVRKKKRPSTEERGFSTPKKSKSRGGWIEDHPTETITKKSKSRGGWIEDHPTETITKKSKSRGGWTAEHPSEQKGYTTPKKSKSRGGWKEEHHEEFFPPMSTRSSFRSSGTPSSRSTNIHYGSENRTPSYKSSKVWNGHTGTSMSQGSARSNYHRFSASRFGNFSTDGPGRHYNWW